MDQNYQYSALDEAVSMMQKATQQVHDKVSNLQQQTTKLLGTFDAASSQTYSARSQTLQRKLHDHGTSMQQLSARTNDGATEMQRADQKSAALFG